ncbi:MAG: type IV pilus twitching motility protein PilT [Gammaproteobacteria bacterium]
MTEKAVTITDLLDFTVENDVSDLHISSGLPPMVRISGDIEKIESPVLSAEDVQKMVDDLTDSENAKEYRERFLKTGDADLSYQHGDKARFRVNLFRQTRGPGIICRTIPTKILSLAELKAPASFKTISQQPRGIVLVTGPTGSGKSTTLAAMINEINISKKEHILTIEDPVEFVHQPQQSLINQREVGAHTNSFAAALRGALREDPDIILIGEMRDPETIGLALSAAETGHLVFGTLHTSSAAKTIDRVVDVFPADEQSMIRAMMSESLRAVISQTLLKKVGGGRVAAHEIMIATPPIRNLIRENKVPQMYSVIQTGMKEGMQTLDQCLKELVAKNLVAKEEAMRVAVKKDDFR